jgi:hypothetical protein
MWLATLVRGCVLPMAVAGAAVIAVAAQGPLPDAIVTRQTSFSIPFRLPPPARNVPDFIEVQLYVSADRGVTWRFYSRSEPSRGTVRFDAAGDGEYWFFLRTMDRSGQLRPQTIDRPGMRVIVDTTPPRLHLEARRKDSGQILIRWNIEELNPKPQSLKIQCRATADQPWQTVPVESLGTTMGTRSGEVAWWPQASYERLEIRGEVADAAGNTAVDHAQITTRPNPLPTPGTPAAASSVGALPNEPLGKPISGNGSHGTGGIAAHPKTGSNSGASPDMPLSVTTPQAQPGWQPASDAPSIPWHSERIGSPAALQGSMERPTIPAGQVAGHEPAPNGAISPSGTEDAGTRGRGDAGTRTADGSTSVIRSKSSDELAASETPPPVSPFPMRAPGAAATPVAEARFAPAPSPSPVATASPQGDVAIEIHSSAVNQHTTATGLASVRKFEGLPPGQKARWVNSRRFQLEYDVESVGPSGIAQVELWGTRDGGRTWNSFGLDRKKKSPFPVVVEEEGLYGFRIVVQSGAGLGGERPKPGDAPDIWIGVDWTRPICRIVSTEILTGDQAGRLLIRWEADDTMLAAQPITLSYGEHREGPWTTIASGLENSGQFTWTVGGRVPTQVYLRLEARDEAGNLGIFETTSPLTLDCLRPSVRIREIRPAEAKQ